MDVLARTARSALACRPAGGAELDGPARPAGNRAGNHVARITPFAPSLTEPGGHSQPSSSAVLTAAARLRVPVLAIAADR
jgi:hypothetical protein